MTARSEHWEPPEPRMLLVSAHRVAAELVVTGGEARVVCWSLERFYYGESSTHFRVSRRSIESFKRLVESGLTHYQARNVMGLVREARAAASG